jgi:hemolysin III
MIYLLIAGTYTPLCLVPLRGPWGFSLLGGIWGLALAGMIAKVFWLQAPRWLSTGIYLLMGWLVVAAISPLWAGLPRGGLLWLGLGGLFYSGGAVVYALKRPDPWPGRFGFHEIWHLMVLAASFCHFWTMLAYVLPLG